MATVAILRSVDVLGLDDLAAIRDRILVVGHFPAHIGYFLYRAEMLLRCAVAVEAPPHAQWLCLVNNFHAVDASVAAYAPNTDINVCGMVEMGVIGYLVDFDPLYRLASFPGFAKGCQLLAVGLNLRVAVHARFSWRNVRLGRYRHRSVTILAVNSQLAGMKSVAVGDGLVGHVADIRELRREVIPNAQDQSCGNYNEPD